MVYLKSTVPYEFACDDRSNGFPTSLNGKAFDTGLVIGWLEDDLSCPSPEAIDRHTKNQLFPSLGSLGSNYI